LAEAAISASWPCATRGELLCEEGDGDDERDEEEKANNRQIGNRKAVQMASYF
jgi:hypothetical protein